MKHKTNRTGLFILTFLLGSIVAFAQGTPNVAGTYEGMVKAPGSTTEQKVSLELKTESGKITGRVTHGSKTAEVSEAKLENDTLTLSIDKDHKFVGKIAGDKLVGEVTDGAQKFPLELRKVTPAASSASPPASSAAEPAPAAAPAAVNLNGQWDAIADANGQPFPFLLTLKVEGENVSGSSSSQLGDATIKAGSWKDGKLSLQVESANGVVSLSATVVEGKLSGEFDYSGQLQGKWVAVKKN